MLSGQPQLRQTPQSNFDFDIEGGYFKVVSFISNIYYPLYYGHMVSYDGTISFNNIDPEGNNSNCILFPSYSGLLEVDKIYFARKVFYQESSGFTYFMVDNGELVNYNGANWGGGILPSSTWSYAANQWNIVATIVSPPFGGVGYFMVILRPGYYTLQFQIDVDITIPTGQPSVQFFGGFTRTTTPIFSDIFNQPSLISMTADHTFNSYIINATIYLSQLDVPTVIFPAFMCTGDPAHSTCKLFNGGINGYSLTALRVKPD